MAMTLISPQALLPRIDDDDCVVVDCRFDLADPDAGRAAWLAGHIPGAHCAHLDDDLAGPVGDSGGRHPLPDLAAFEQRLADWGIREDSLVVAYDDAGGAIAGRLWWLLRDCGHERVALLDGGFRAWQAAGLPVETHTPETGAAPVRQLVTGQMPTLDAAAVARVLRDGAMVLIDVRAPARFAGAEEPLDKQAGHVPGALNLPLTGNVDADGRFLSRAALGQRFRELLGGRAPADAVIMCGSGVSACQTLLAMEHAGLPGASLYTGSWSDWISDPARPIARL
ncbi:MAG: sulfurtransferase [Chromatiales bacterium]|nr:MAG: sulfurtransferase [Chromatiales bacterium]